MPVLNPIPPTDLNNLDKSFRAPLDAADGGATPGRRGELGFPLYLAFVPFRPDASDGGPRRPRAGGKISRGPPLWASHASRRVPCLLVSYKPLASQKTSVKLLLLKALCADCSGCEFVLTHLLRAQQPSRLAPLLELHPSSSTSVCYLGDATCSDDAIAAP